MKKFAAEILATVLGAAVLRRIADEVQELIKYLRSLPQDMPVEVLGEQTTAMGMDTEIRVESEHVLLICEEPEKSGPSE